MITLLTHADFAEIVKKCRDEWMDENGYTDPAEINRGDCEDFASFVAIRVQEIDDGDYEYADVAVWWDNDALDCAAEDSTYPGHAFLVFDGRYYDSEAPDGVDNWRELPIFAKWEEKCRAQHKS